MEQIKKEDLNNLTTDDLKQRLHDDGDRLQKLKFNHAVNPLENPMQIRYLRKEIARLKTELRNRELTAK